MRTISILLILIFYSLQSYSIDTVESKVTYSDTMITDTIDIKKIDDSIILKSESSEEPSDKKNIDFNIMLGIIAIIVALIIAIIPWIRKKFFIRPELTFELIPDGGLNSNEGLSWKNDLSKGYIEGEKAIHVWGLKWKYKLIIRNNSDVTAFYPKIYRKSSGIWFTKIDSLNNLKPIKTSDDDIVLKCEYQKYTESIPSERPKLDKFPVEFQDLKILLEYKNSAKSRFYTLFEFDNFTNNNNFIRFKPKGFA
ncbi:MAG: hypothetical protein JXB49_25030 [Bacteroidales bacterium]|nr:hypothetical protein [Bacteroidales bacterium]